MPKFKNIIAFGISYRIIIFIFLIIFPFEHLQFGSIDPISYQDFGDFQFYYKFGEKEFEILNFLSNYYSVLTLNISNIDNRFPGPLFPALIFITQYSENFTYIMATVIFASEITAYIIWSHKKFKNNNLLSLIFFSLMPIPLYFGFVHSTDTIMYLLCTLLYFEIKDEPKKNILIILFFLILCCRPNSSIIFLLCIFYFSFIKKNRYFTKLSLLFFLVSIFYYSPYYFFEMYGVKQINDNNIIFLLINYLKNIILLVGFVPSGSGNEFFYLLRCFCGAIFFIGMINLFIKRANKIDLLFVSFFIFITASVFFPAYRYILPITPILIYYFSDFAFKKR